jgi:hypothetical protein
LQHCIKETATFKVVVSCGCPVFFSCGCLVFSLVVVLSCLSLENVFFFFSFFMILFCAVKEFKNFEWRQEGLVSSRLVLLCLVLACPVLSCLVLSCLALSCLVLSCLALAWLWLGLACGEFSWLACLVLACLVLACLVVCFLVSSYVSFIFFPSLLLSYVVLS